MSAVDPAKIARFREKLHQEWTNSDTIAAWRKWRPQLSAFSQGATEANVRAAQLCSGMSVLDLASGTGEPALQIAEAVGPTGYVVATDIGPGMIGLAEEIARAKGLKQIDFRVVDVEAIPFPDETFDAVTSRFGVMFFTDQVKAFRECRRVLKRGGRIAFVVWGTKQQPFLTSTIDVLMKYVDAPPPDPDAPHAFMFGERGLLTERLKDAGFLDAREEIKNITGRWTGTPEEFWQQFTEVAAPFRPLVAKLTLETRAKVESEVFANLRKYGEGRGLTIPLEIVVGTGTRE